MRVVSPCPNCGGQNLYRSKPVTAGGVHADYLPGLGRFRAAKFRLVLCGDCGLTRFFAESKALERLADSVKWEPVAASDRAR